ncbi:hypothetical protein [Streptomyces sp. AP-93]|uniref:hypothetical protein n=1 Tax=Streptomyces sp. AP-93 TaxID=2929048 RepID=UPI001FAE99AC|nr:hypothetical protein [Streptomyces sp. AP-93]MCJ0872561.1 hypothetical protein [Streptomyces sp. AP-93]
MIRNRIRRLAVLTASTALAAGAVSVSSTACAAPAALHSATIVTTDSTDGEGSGLFKGGSGGDLYRDVLRIWQNNHAKDEVTRPAPIAKWDSRY